MFQRRSSSFLRRHKFLKLFAYPSGLEDAIEFLSSLSHIADVFIVLGNHDHWSGLTSIKLKQFVKNFGNIYVLDNEALFYDGF